MSDQAQSSSTDRLAETTRETGRRAKERMRTLAERASEKWQTTRETAGAKSQDARHRASETAHRVQAHYQDTRERSVRTVQEHPLAIAAGALGLGMLIGLAIRESRREHEMLDERARTARERVKEAGREAAERGQAVAERTVQSAKEAAQREGLTPETVKDEAEQATRAEQPKREGENPIESWGRQE